MVENVRVVRSEEHHWLPTCPCVGCVEERRRRAIEKSGPANSHIRLIPPAVAFTLGLTRRINPAGSVAKVLARVRGV